MRKRLIFLAVVLVVVAGALSAAKVVQLPNHVRLHGGANVVGGQIATINVKTLDAVGGVEARRPAGVPANAHGTEIILHGSLPAGKSPALAGGTWTCDVWQYAWKYDAHTMQGNAAYNCDGATLIIFDEYADYCAPLLWGCTWQNKYTFSSCNYVNPTSGACPKSGNYDLVYNIASGQLWRERAHVCAWGPPGTTSMCGDPSEQVQF